MENTVENPRAKAREEAREELDWLSHDKRWRGMVLVYGPAPADMEFRPAKGERMTWVEFLLREARRIESAEPPEEGGLRPDPQSPDQQSPPSIARPRAPRRARIKWEGPDVSLYVADPQDQAHGSRQARVQALHLAAQVRA